LEEIMSIERFVAALGMAVVVAPVFADLPDGHGGRTAPQGSHTVVVASPSHACCDTLAPPTTRIAAGPADVKARGHLAGIARADDPIPAMPCYKSRPTAPAVYTYSAELKATGHVAASSAAPHAPAVARGCCEQARCPMRRAS
jgi:hypothetical protein